MGEKRERERMTSRRRWRGNEKRDNNFFSNIKKKYEGRNEDENTEEKGYRERQTTREFEKKREIQNRKEKNTRKAKENEGRHPCCRQILLLPIKSAPLPASLPPPPIHRGRGTSAWQMHQYRESIREG